MEFFYSLEFAVPVAQIALLLLLSTTALLFGKIKLALLISYLFTLHWGYFINRELTAVRLTFLKSKLTI